MQIRRTKLSEVIEELKIKAPGGEVVKRTRILALKWGAFQARQEFTDFGKRMEAAGGEFKKHPIISVWDIGINTVGLADVVLSATVHAIRGVVGFVFPVLTINGSEYTQREIQLPEVDKRDSQKVKPKENSESPEELNWIDFRKVPAREEKVAQDDLPWIIRTSMAQVQSYEKVESDGEGEVESDGEDVVLSGWKGYIRDAKAQIQNDSD